MRAPTPRTGLDGYWRESLILQRSLNSEADFVDGFAAGDVEGFEVVIAEGAVGEDFFAEHRLKRLAFGGVDLEAIGADVEAACHIRFDAVGDSFDVPDEVAGVRRGTSVVEVEGDYGVAIGVGGVEGFAVGREGDSVGAGLPLSYGFELGFGGEVEDPVEVEFAGVDGVAEGGVGEVDLAVFADDDVVGGV
jgi:hypothetical protein